jgi:hypothetical protein
MVKNKGGGRDAGGKALTSGGYLDKNSRFNAGFMF